MLVFPRVKPTGEAVVHLVNTGYDPASDRVPPRRMVRVELPAGILQGSFRGATLRSFDAPPVELRMEGDQGAFLVAVPEVRTWAVLELAR